jgi:ABC-type uncharacterized transport system substrate-binding protein
MKKAGWSLILVAAMLLPVAVLAQAQQEKVYRVGVVLPGGAFYETIDGLRVGLKQLGLQDGIRLNLVIRETKGDAKAAEETAKNFEK